MAIDSRNPLRCPRGIRFSFARLIIHCCYSYERTVTEVKHFRHRRYKVCFPKPQVIISSRETLPAPYPAPHGGCKAFCERKMRLCGSPGGPAHGIYIRPQLAVWLQVMVLYKKRLQAVRTLMCPSIISSPGGARLEEASWRRRKKGEVHRRPASVRDDRLRRVIWKHYLRYWRN